MPKLHEILEHCQMCMPNKEPPYYSHRKLKKVLIVIMDQTGALRCI
jgi:hypothetical protein